MNKQYKLAPADFWTKTTTSVFRVEDNSCIPFTPANTDYQQFKTDVLGGEELQDADGNVMTQEEANNFIAELP